MTEDIVDRLRKIAAITANWANTDEAAIRKTCREAAAEIERLRGLRQEQSADDAATLLVR